MLFRNRKQARLSKVALSLAIAFAVGGVVVTDALAQSDSGSERRNRRSQGNQKVEVRYPDATRAEPKEKGSAKMGKKLQKLIEEFNDSKFEEAKPLANEILADAKLAEMDDELARMTAASFGDAAGDENYALEVDRDDTVN